MRRSKRNAPEKISQRMRTRDCARSPARLRRLFLPLRSWPAPSARPLLPKGLLRRPSSPPCANEKTCEHAVRARRSGRNSRSEDCETAPCSPGRERAFFSMPCVGASQDLALSEIGPADGASSRSVRRLRLGVPAFLRFVGGVASLPMQQSSSIEICVCCRMLHRRENVKARKKKNEAESPSSVNPPQSALGMNGIVFRISDSAAGRPGELAGCVICDESSGLSGFQFCESTEATQSESSSCSTNVPSPYVRRRENPFIAMNGAALRIPDS